MGKRRTAWRGLGVPGSSSAAEVHVLEGAAVLIGDVGGWRSGIGVRCVDELLRGTGLARVKGHPSKPHETTTVDEALSTG
jgi:hypothetical protein